MDSAKVDAELRAAAESDLEAQREAAALKEAAMHAEKGAQAAKKSKVTGLRAVTKYEITDHRALLHWIAANDKSAMTAFIEDWARRNHKQHPDADGLTVWETEEAY